MPLYHMDLYRISDPEELEMTGAKDLIFSGGVSVIEWAEKIGEYLPEEIIKINITIDENRDRIITIDGIDI